MQRHIRQNLAVQIQPGGLQAVQELAIGNARVAAGSVDAHDPQRAVLALLVLSAYVGELQAALDRFLRGAMQLALGEKITRRQLQRLFPGSPAVGTTFNSRHVSSPYKMAAGQNGRLGLADRARATRSVRAKRS